MAEPDRKKPARKGGKQGDVDAKPSVGSSSGLQPSGTKPGRSPAVGMGSMGTGGGSTAGAATGSVAQKRRVKTK